MELDLVRKVWMILKWDEPLNYIDILTRIQIEEAILNYRPTIIFVEHDETFIEKLIDKIKNNRGQNRIDASDCGKRQAASPENHGRNGDKTHDGPDQRDAF